MRLRVLALAFLALIGASALAPAAIAAPAHRIFAQENRPTNDQPSPGAPFARPPESRDWSFNWVARPLVAVVALLIVALLAGFAFKWIGVGHRAP